MIGVDFIVVMFIVYNCFVEFECGGMKVEFGFVEKWDVLFDGKVYMFYLCYGVKFYMIDFFKLMCEFNVDDVVFLFQCMFDLNNVFCKVYLVLFLYFIDMGFDKLIMKVEKVDLYIVKFMLVELNVLFIQNMVMEFVLILLVEYGDQLMKVGKVVDINQKLVGMGLFIFCSYMKDVMICFDGNFDYWKKGEVKLLKLIFLIMLDLGVCVQKIKCNECQVMSYLCLVDIVMLKVDLNVDMLLQVGFNFGYFVYNVEYKLVDKFEVCQVFDMVINKKVIFEFVYQGVGQVVSVLMLLI